MSTQTISAEWSGTDREIEKAVQTVLRKQILSELLRTSPHELDREADQGALDMFEDWADGYGLSTTPSVLAAFMIELKQNGADIAALKHLATAYLRQHERDVHVPIRAALKYCSK